MTNATAAYLAAHTANDRLNRAVSRLNWLNCGKGPDAFVIHADALAKIQAEADKTSAAWKAVVATLTPDEIIKTLVEA